jgi:hypothetical protein
MLPPTSTRVSEQSSQQSNDRIDRELQQNVIRYSRGGITSIDHRLADLEHEWDIERTLQTNFAVVTMVGVALSALVDRRWILFSAAAAGFMVQHALQGWCPPVPIFRRLGFRTSDEIDNERYAFKALRGDFTHSTDQPDSKWAIDAAQR